MSFTITKTGPHRDKNGCQCRVVHIDGKWAIGFDSGNEPCAWQVKNGISNTYDRCNIVAEWTEPIDPGEGWRLLWAGEKVLDGDEFCFGETWKYGAVWAPCASWQINETPDALLRKYNQTDAHYRRRITAPFRISTHGPGIYGTRDGREATVDRNDGPGYWPWSGTLDCGPNEGVQRLTWRDNGKWHSDNNIDSSHDLVRYIGPLPEPEKWVPTCELRWSDFVGLPKPGSCWVTVCNNDGTHSCNRQLQQRWTCGDKEQWRAVGVEQ